MQADAEAAFSIGNPAAEAPAIARHRGKFAHRLPDYGESSSEAISSFSNQAITRDTQHKEYEVHEYPIEVEAKQIRQATDIYAALKPNQILFTNLPADVKEGPLGSTHKLKKYLRQRVHKDLKVTNSRFIDAITTNSQPDRSAYLLVTVGSKRQAHMVARALRQVWFGDHLLKSKLAGEVSREHFDNRTVLIRGLPGYMTQNDVLETFVKEDDGAVVGLEMPIENIKVAEYLTERQLTGDSTLAQEKERKFRQAQVTVKQQLDIDQEIQQATIKAIGIDAANGKSHEDLLSSEKQAAAFRMVTRLQAEGQQVLQSKIDLHGLRKYTVGDTNHGTETAFKAVLKDNKKALD